MNVVVFGGEGFIGGKFVELYGMQFEKVFLITRSDTAQNKIENNRIYCTVEAILDGKVKLGDVAAVINADFDYRYVDNEALLQSTWQLINQYSIARLIYLSSIAVYDSSVNGVLTEESPYSQLHDPYVAERQRMERLLTKLASNNKTVAVSILQPAVDYGVGSNWTQNAVSAALSNALDLPMSGSGICNAVHVNDVAAAIMSRVMAQSDPKISRIVVSGPGPLTWRQFYQGHAQALGVELPSERFVDGGMRLHSRLPIHYLLSSWFNSPLGYAFNWLVKLANRLRNKRSVPMNAVDAIRQRLQRGQQGHYRPVAMTRVAHACKYTIDDRYAQQLYPAGRTTFEEGIADIKRQL